jgi:hypothetical protein
MSAAELERSELIRRSKEIYDKRLKVELERTHLDYFVAIEPDSGEYFLGKTLTEAASGFREAHPNRRAYVLRVGHPAALHIGAGALKN